MKVLKLQVTNMGHGSALILVVLIGISIACSTLKSAGHPQDQLTQNQLTTQSPTPVSTSAQESGTCTLKISEAAAIEGLKLGMTVDEILALFPGSKEDPALHTAVSGPPGRFGNSSLTLTPSKYGTAAKYKGISRLTFSVLDGRIYNFTVSYNGPQYPDVDKFIEKFSEGKNLPPPDQWEAYAGMNTQMKTLTCNGFSIRIFAGGEEGSLNYVLVEDLEADKKLKDRRKKAREQASPTPTPTSTPG